MKFCIGPLKVWKGLIHWYCKICRLVLITTVFREDFSESRNFKVGSTVMTIVGPHATVLDKYRDKKIEHGPNVSVFWNQRARLILDQPSPLLISGMKNSAIWKNLLRVFSILRTSTHYTSFSGPINDYKLIN